MKETMTEQTWYETIKEDFIKNISDTYTLNLAVSILEDRKELLDENLDLQSQLKAKDEAVEKFEKYLNNCVNELENNYGLSSIQNAINTGIIDITKVILSKFNEILSKGENK